MSDRELTEECPPGSALRCTQTIRYLTTASNSSNSRSQRPTLIREINGKIAAFMNVTRHFGTLQQCGQPFRPPCLVIVNSNTAASSICGIGGFAMLHRTANRTAQFCLPIFGLSGTLRHSERLGSLTCQKSACEC